MHMSSDITGSMAIYKSLSENKTLTNIDVSKSNIVDCRNIGSVLKQNKHLKSIQLDDNPINSDDLEIIYNNLKEKATVTSLSFLTILSATKEPSSLLAF